MVIKMKKGYFIAYLGAAATMGIVLSKATKMSKKYGKEIVFNGNSFYTFPTPAELSKATIGALASGNVKLVISSIL